MRLPALLALSFALHLYSGLRVLPATGWPAWALAAGTLLLAASALLVPTGLIARRLARPPWSDRLAWAGLLAMGLFSSLLVLTLLRDALLLLQGLARLAGWDWGAQWQRTTALAVPLLAATSTLLGFWNARRTPPVRRLAVRLPGLPHGFAGLRIAQISDIHVGPTIKRGYLQAVVDRVNALTPDLVAVTGDLVDGSVAELAPHVAPLAALRSRHGSFFVTGNHEYYSGVHGWLAELRRLGLRVLHNEHVVLRSGPAQLVLAGVTDYSGGHFAEDHRSDPQAALAGAPADTVRILLAHQPRSATAAARAGFHLQLSGHTHGGQFLPWTFFVPLQQPFTAGLHRLDGLQIYVSRGTGYWGPPKRFGAPSEITEITLLPSE